MSDASKIVNITINGCPESTSITTIIASPIRIFVVRWKMLSCIILSGNIHISNAVSSEF